MENQPDEETHPLLRKTVFVIMALILLVVLGRVAVEAVSFISETAAKPAEIRGMNYTITGSSCGIEDDAADCCEIACTSWCSIKGSSVLKAGVADTELTKCSCVCSFG